MKKVLMGCMTMMTLTCAGDYLEADRIFDMQKMAQAMQDIQSGFFYNNVDIVKAGAEDLKATIVRVGPIKKEIENKDVYERWMNDSTAMKHRVQRKIVQDANDIIERFSDGDATQALQVYAKIADECMKCHVSLRKW